jgi:hypothetical protein
MGTGLDQRFVGIAAHRSSLSQGHAVRFTSANRQGLCQRIGLASQRVGDGVTLVRPMQRLRRPHLFALNVSHVISKGGGSIHACKASRPMWSKSRSA